MRRIVLAIAFGIAFLAPPGAHAELSRSSAVARKWMETPAASRADCLRAVGMLLDGRSAGDDLAALTTRLRQLRIAKSADLESPDKAATRGYACLLFMRALGERGGVVCRVFKNSPHAAYRHLTYLGLVRHGGSGTAISGPELVSLVSLSRRWVAANGRPKGGRSS